MLAGNHSTRVTHVHYCNAGARGTRARVCACVGSHVSACVFVCMDMQRVAVCWALGKHPPACVCRLQQPYPHSSAFPARSAPVGWVPCNARDSDPGDVSLSVMTTCGIEGSMVSQRLPQGSFATLRSMLDARLDAAVVALTFDVLEMRRAEVQSHRQLRFVIFLCSLKAEVGFHRDFKTARAHQPPHTE